MTGSPPAADPFVIAARALALAAVLSLGFFIGGGWVTDDFTHILDWRDRGASQVLLGADRFGFYRPVSQFSLWLEARAHGLEPALFRIVNVGLHAGIWLLAYLAARSLMTARAASLAALAFVLAPKSPSIAVLWISARPELLMSVCSLIAAWAWLRWQTRGGRWIALAAGAYVAAFLAKESAALLPLALMTMMTPSCTRSWRGRAVAAAMMLALAIVPLWLRWHAGALMPWSVDPHYSLDWSLYRLARGVEIYVPRALPAQLALLIVVGMPAALAGTAPAWRQLRSTPGIGQITLVAVAWFAVLMLPVIPIPARSELYLYFPAFGFCLLAGVVVDRLLTTVTRPRPVLAALVVYSLALLSYQALRHARAHEVQLFTAGLVESIAADPWFAAEGSAISFAAADPDSEQLMRDGVGGYINGVLALALSRRQPSARVIYSGDPAADAGSRIVTFAFADGDVTLRHEP